MVMRTSAWPSSYPFACWTRHALLDDLTRPHTSSGIYGTISTTGRAFKAVIAVWIVTWHLITPVLVSALAAALNIPYLSDDDVIVSIVVGVSPMFDQRRLNRPALTCHLSCFTIENREYTLLILTKTRMKNNIVTLHRYFYSIRGKFITRNSATLMV